MTSDAQKRQFVSDLYSGHGWKKRVERMSDDQITAIYLRSQRQEPVPEDTHSELDGFDKASEPEFPVVDIPVFRAPEFGLGGPHANEDEFPIY